MRDILQFLADFLSREADIGTGLLDSIERTRPDFSGFTFDNGGVNAFRPKDEDPEFHPVILPAGLQKVKKITFDEAGDVKATTIVLKAKPGRKINDPLYRGLMNQPAKVRAITRTSREAFDVFENRPNPWLKTALAGLWNTMFRKPGIDHNALITMGNNLKKLTMDKAAISQVIGMLNHASNINIMIRGIDRRILRLTSVLGEEDARIEKEAFISLEEQARKDGISIDVLVRDGAMRMGNNALTTVARGTHFNRFKDEEGGLHRVDPETGGEYLNFDQLLDQEESKAEQELEAREADRQAIRGDGKGPVPVILRQDLHVPLHEIFGETMLNVYEFEVTDTEKNTTATIRVEGNIDDLDKRREDFPFPRFIISKNHRVMDPETDQPVRIRTTHAGRRIRRPHWTYFCASCGHEDLDSGIEMPKLVDLKFRRQLKQMSNPKTWRLMQAINVGFTSMDEVDFMSIAALPDEWKTKYKNEDGQMNALQVRSTLGFSSLKTMRTWIRRVYRISESACRQCGASTMPVWPIKKMGRDAWRPVMITERDMRPMPMRPRNMSDVDVNGVLTDIAPNSGWKEEDLGKTVEQVDGITWIQPADWWELHKQNVEFFMDTVKSSDITDPEIERDIRKTFKSLRADEGRFMRAFLRTEIQRRKVEKASSNKEFMTLAKTMAHANFTTFHQIRADINRALKSGKIKLPTLSKDMLWKFINTMGEELMADAVKAFFAAKENDANELVTMIDGIQSCDMADFQDLNAKVNKACQDQKKPILGWQIFMLKDQLAIRWKELRSMAFPTEFRQNLKDLPAGRFTAQDVRRVQFALQVTKDSGLAKKLQEINSSGSTAA